MLLDAATSLNNRADDIVQAMKDEIGATEAWARFNVMLASNMLIEAASLTTQIKGEIIPSNRPGSMAMARIPNNRLPMPMFRMDSDVPEVEPVESK